MIKKIQVMDIELDNYSTRESMMLIETFLNNTVLNTIEEISLNMLVQAGQNEIVKECITSLNLAVPGDPEILVEAGYKNTIQMHDLGTHDFFHEFAKRVIRNKKSVFLLAENEEKKILLREYLEKKYERMQIIGQCSLDSFAEETGVVNEINISAPDVILSVISSPKQELFLAEYKSLLHAKIWYGMNDQFLNPKGRKKFMHMLKNMAGRVIFHRHLLNFQKEKDNE